MYRQVYDPVTQSLALSALFALVPLGVMFVMLGWLRRSPQLSALVSLLACLGVATFVYGVPLGTAVNFGLYGAAFSLLTVVWIVLNAIWIYNLTVKSGHFAILRQSFARISGDPCVQSIIIAFCFGALLEALAGAGTPIAIVSAMLVALGVSPMKAVVLALIGDTAPVVFGALAVPIYTLTQVSGLPFDHLGAMVGRQTSIIAVPLPMVIVFVMGGWRGVRDNWGLALATGVTFGAAQFATSNYLSIPLADVLAVLAATIVVLAYQKLGAGGMSSLAQPRSSTVGAAQVIPAAGLAGGRYDTWLAYAPYVFVVAVFSLAQVGPIQRLLGHGVVRFPWPGLAVTDAAGGAVNTTYNLNYLPASGSLLFVCGVLTMLVLRVSAATAWRSFRDTLYQLRWAIPTILCVLALAFVMNWSGQSATLGRFLARTGPMFAFISPIVGWVGVVVTGSDNSTNALFGALQVEAARATGLPPVLLAAANTSGGVLGKIISPQSLAVGAAAVGLIGREGDVFRRVLGWTLLLLALLSILVYLQSTPLLSWMVVG